MAERTLHPRHGVHDPTAGTPARAPGSVRRTSTIDMLRPDGLFGPLVLVGRARDLVTDAGGVATTTGVSECCGRVDFMAGRLLTEVRSQPARRALQALIGQRVSSGFRAAVQAADPDLGADDSLLNLLLDDFPVATLVSGHAIAAGLTGNGRPALSLAEATGQPRAEGLPPGLTAMSARPAFIRDLCAGFADGGTIMNGVDANGRPPVVTGPEAPPLTTDDELAWHELDPLPAGAMRRSRRLDLVPGPVASVDVLFRDAHVDDEGVETIVHEYTVSAAALSAGRLVGMPVAGLRQHVRDTFLGTSTCTHLNDTLRSLEDLPALLQLAGDHNLTAANA